MRALLDTNFVIALFDERHVFHVRASAWWDQHSAQGWASCPLTENGVIRILSGPAYRTQRPLTPGNALAMLQRFVEDNDHEFWTDDISLREETIFKFDRVHSAGQLTDIYLLALAHKKGGRLVTFDSRIPLNAVTGAAAEHLHTVT